MVGAQGHVVQSFQFTCIHRHLGHDLRIDEVHFILFIYFQELLLLKPCFFCIVPFLRACYRYWPKPILLSEIANLEPQPRRSVFSALDIGFYV